MHVATTTATHFATFSSVSSVAASSFIPVSLVAIINYLINILANTPTKIVGMQLHLHVERKFAYSYAHL